MSTQTQEARLGLYGTSCSEHTLLMHRISPAFFHEPAWTFDPEQRFELESCFAHFNGELLGVVEVGRGEPFGMKVKPGVSMLPFTEVALHHLREICIDQGASP